MNGMRAGVASVQERRLKGFAVTAWLCYQRQRLLAAATSYAAAGCYSPPKPSPNVQTQNCVWWCVSVDHRSTMCTLIAGDQMVVVTHSHKPQTCQQQHFDSL